MTYQKALAALVDPTRREVFEVLRSGPIAVGDLAKRLPVSTPAVSQHLRVLKQANLVSCTAIGTRRIYSIEPEGLRGLQEYLSSFWGDALEAFRTAADREAAVAGRDDGVALSGAKGENVRGKAKSES